MAIKINIHKTFDTISWRFLLSMLQRLGFSASFCDKISVILHSARLSVSLMGDPLSPLLFYLAEAAWGRWVDWEVTSGRLVQILRAPRYLFYADDILNFARAIVGNIRCLQGILSAYWSLFGQVHNSEKSMVYFGTTVTHRVRQFMLRTTGISHGSLPFSYLGVPIFRGSPRTCHLATLADSIISKFSKWKGHSMSLAGRKCMINFVIAASLVHSMMVYYWPRTLLKKIEDAMRNFLWKGDISQRNNSCSVSWARVCSPLDEGGMGVRSIRLANDSFIWMLAWDILCSRYSDMAVLHDRYITTGGRPCASGHPSSIRPGIH
ncbi:hypothetical protein ACS0TY_018021 [Phlomoides rotata]